MSQFVLYIEHLLRTHHSKLNGISAGTRTLTCVGYADDITCIVRSEDDVARINDTLSALTRAATAQVNSAKTKLLDLKPQSHALRQVSPYKTIIQQFTSENREVTALHRAVWTNYHILPRHYLQALQGVKQTLIELQAGISITRSILCKHHRSSVNVGPRVHLKWANLHWNTVWKNIADVELPTALRASAYSFVNDLTPTKIHVNVFSIDLGLSVDIALHEDLTGQLMTYSSLPSNGRAVVWLFMNLIDFNVNMPTPFHLREFVDRLRRVR
ncbi:hypothetical protein PR048_000620 [Dryococelus australis]|uniref:Reverse transcriptase domain-containing protein n=1 Tax=Dryococelus australis TaxID=614101 RepID=A0ABQ9IF58_9NEOP|nr:hypothetical protein PR048_000620 [Dryococelus australis]